MKLNDTSLASGADKELALFKEVIDHNIGKKIIEDNFIHKQGKYLIQQNVEENSRFSIMFCY